MGRIARAAAALVVAAAIYLGAAVSPASAALLGDVDGNCWVNSADLAFAARAYGYSWGSLRYVRAADINNDRTINVIDLQIIASRMGTHC